LAYQEFTEGDFYILLSQEGAMQFECRLYKLPSVTTDLDDYEDNYQANADGVDIRTYNKIIYELVDLENAGSNAMNVDGTSPNISFKYIPAAGEVRYLDSIIFFLLDPGTMAHNVFGALGSALTTGLKIKVKVGGTEYTNKDIVDNVDVLMAFPNVVNTGQSATAFLNEEDYFFGSWLFSKPLKLEGDDGDLVKIIIRDDLTGISRMRSQALIYRYV